MWAAMPEDPSPATGDPDVAQPCKPKVTAFYSPKYKPHFDVTSLIVRMAESVPPKYLVGLSEIVLTDQGELPRNRRRSVTYSRKKKVRITNTCGLYHPAWKRERPWIEIFVDAILKPWEKGLWLKIPFLRETELGEVLFHEIGHHIHCSVCPEYREKEDVADVWKVRLQRNYARKRFVLLRMLFRFLRLFAAPFLDRLQTKLMKAERQKGRMSQAEFEESTRPKPRK